MADTPSIDIREDWPRPEPEKPVVSKAVAIEYDRGKEQAPKVTASGSGNIAEQILQIAFDRGIKVRQDAELVEILSLVDVESPIPLEAFSAVAEILAHVYAANATAKQRAMAGRDS